MACARSTALFVAMASSLALAPSALADSKAEARRHFAAGMKLVEEGRYAEGIELLERAYGIRPHPSVLFNIARARVSNGQLEIGIDNFEQYLESDPSDAAHVREMIGDLRVRVELRNTVDEGMKAVRAGRYAEGIALLLRAYEQRPHPNLLFNIARAREDAGDVDRALETYRRYLETKPTDAARVMERVARLLEKKEAGSSAAANLRATAPSARAPTERSKEAKRTPPTSRTETPPASMALDEATLETWIDRIVERLRGSDATRAAGEHIEARTPASVGGEGAATMPSDEKMAADASDPRTGANEAANRAVQSSTAAISAAAVTVDAKSGEAYEDVVVTASRRAESPLDAPNAVTIITDEDIRLSGARTIPDLLRRVPGMDVVAMSYSDFNVAMRGFNRRIANKILVLIDGRTAYQDFLGLMLWRGTMINLEDIDRIEVVRGPGSAIYGAYAYTGVVNIITKRPTEALGTLVSVTGGNGERVEAAVRHGVKRGPISMRLSMGYDRGDKYEIEFDPKRIDYTSSEADAERSLEQVRVDATTEYKLDDDVGRFFLGGSGRTGFQEVYGVSSLRNQAVDGEEYNLRGGFESDLVTMRAFWNGLRTDSSPQFFRTGLDDLGSRIHSDVMSVEPVFRPTFRLFGEHALVVGGEYRHKYTDWSYLSGTVTEDHFALFFQDAWALIPELSLIASGRLDLHPLIGPLASPRVAAIFKPSPHQAIRISTGTAFRHPTMAETYVDLAASSPVAGIAVNLRGGRELDPESIFTVDVGYRRQADVGEFEAVAYVNRVSNLITQTPLTPASADETFREDLGAFIGATSDYINESRKFIAIGSELSLRLFPIDGIDLGASYAFQYIFDEATGARYTDSPMHKATLWGQLRTELGIDAALSVHFVSEQAWNELRFDPDDPTGFESNALAVDSSFVVIARLGYRMLSDRLELSLSGTNLADFGSARHREHPFANRVEARVAAGATVRF